jgi:hypothetical protein
MTEKSYLEVCPPSVQDGDLVVILYGGKVPYVLRSMQLQILKRPGGGSDSDSMGQYALIGECYLHGVMDGSAMTEQRLDLRTQLFDIR